MSAHHPWKIVYKMLILLSGVLLPYACTEKEESYPNLITEFADLQTDYYGVFLNMTTDDGSCYLITNTNIQPHHPNTVYRAIVGYVPTTKSTHLEALIYTLTGARILADSTTTPQHDPIGIESMWQEGKYINMQLTAKTQGGHHYWGYVTDSIKHIGKEGRKNAHFHLSLHHNQRKDPLSYSQTYYSSILTSAIPQYQETDTITVAVHTFNGIKKWMFYK